MSNRIGVMSQGALLQVGTPHEIYEHPVNRFVADFIGETNFLEGHVNGAGVCLGTGDLLEVPLEVPLDGQLGAVTLAIRPEQIRLAAAGTGIAATITDATYMGTDTHYTLGLSDGSHIVARVQSNSASAHGVGEEVGISIDAKAVQVLKA